MDCGVCVGGFDGHSDFFKVAIRSARKDYKCCECEEPILKGQRYDGCPGFEAAQESVWTPEKEQEMLEKAAGGVERMNPNDNEANMIAAVLRETLPEVAPQEEIPNPMEVRKALWLGHGHSGMYGDDGEMQCGMCRVWDYRRAPFLQIVAQVHGLMLESLRSASEERDRARDALRGLMDGLDDYWTTTPEGEAAVVSARAALKPVSDRQPEGER